MKTEPARRFRRQPVDPWSKHNLNLIRAACDVTLRRHGLYVNEGFNYGSSNPKAGRKK